MGRLLLARFHSLGDAALATGIAERLSLEGERVEIATGEGLLPLFEGGSAAALWTPGELAGAGRFDRVIDLQNNSTSRRLVRGLGPTRRAHGRGLARRWVVFWGRRPPRPRIPHAVLRYAEAAEIEETDPRRLRPVLRVTSRDIEEARRLARSWQASEPPCVALAPGASRGMKRWPEERFADLAQELSRRGRRSLRFLEPHGRPEEGDGWVRAPLRALKALLGRCSALVTNDSGVMHVGVGLGLPVVAVFASTTLDFGFGPLGDRDRVVEQDLPCRPCAVHGARFCWQTHAACLRGIGVERVLAALAGAAGDEEEGWSFAIP